MKLFQVTIICATILTMFNAGICVHAQSWQFNYENDVKDREEIQMLSLDCGMSSTDYQYYNSLSTHIPTAGQPDKVVKVNFNVFNHATNSSFNFPNNQTSIDRLNQIFQWFRDYYISNGTPSNPIPGVNDLTKTHIDFELQGIYFYSDNSLYNTATRTVVQNALQIADPERLNSINVYFTSGFRVGSVNVINGGSGYVSVPTVTIAPPNDGGTQATAVATINLNGSITGISMTNRGSGYFNSPTITISGGGGSGAIATSNLYIESGNALYPVDDFNIISDIFMFNAHNGSDYPTATTLAHEMGHILDLSHTYDSGAPCSNTENYLEDVFGSFPPSVCPHSCSPSWDAPFNYPCTNNMMSGHRDAEYFSPLQIGKMHRALSLLNVRKYIKGCDYPHNPIEISSNQTWDFPMWVFTDIIVKSGKTLNIKCEIGMGENRKIIVEPNAHLIVDGGVITKFSNCNSRWRGIYVSGNSTASQTLSPALFGKLTVKNGAIIEHV
jgi:hypothetical protein